MTLADHPQHPPLQGLLVRRIRRELDPLQVIHGGRGHFRQAQARCIKQVQAQDKPLWFADLLDSLVNCASMKSHCAKLKLRPALTLGPAVRSTLTADPGLPIRQF